MTTLPVAFSMGWGMRDGVQYHHDPQVVIVVESLQALAKQIKLRENSSDDHEAVTKEVHSGHKQAPKYPCHNLAFPSISLSTCRFEPM